MCSARDDEWASTLQKDLPARRRRAALTTWLTNEVTGSTLRGDGSLAAAVEGPPGKSKYEIN